MILLNKKIVLGSGSPRRQLLLKELGLNFRTLISDISEIPIPGLFGGKIAEYLSDEKADALKNNIYEDETIQYFEEKKINAVYIQQAFDDSILQQLAPKSNVYKGDVVFIGNFALGHNYRFEVLEYLLQNKVDLTIYGSGKNYVPKTSLVQKKIQPGLFGIDMYNEYQNYKMAIHIHTTGFENDGINWDKYAGAKRLFEITGSGTLFLTTHQQNIKDLYEIDKEVVTFKNAEELLQKINYFLSHSDEAETIAKNGQLRTLKSHSFTARANELEPILFSTNQ